MAKLYFYYASMNAGKSTTLLQADFNYRERGLRTMLYTAAVHDRSGYGVIDLAHRPQGGRQHLRARDLAPRRGRGRDQAPAGRLHPARRGAVPDPRPGAGPRRDLRRAQDPGPRLRPQDRLPGQSVRRQRRPARLGRYPGRAEGDLRVRPQGDDEPQGRRGRPRRQGAGAQTEIGGNDRYIALCRRHFMERLREAEERQACR